MGISFDEVKYYKSGVVDFGDDTQNGLGVKGIEIVNDQIGSTFPEVSATERESGKVMRMKFIVTNKSATRSMQSCIFYLAQDALAPDRVKLYQALQDERMSLVFQDDIDGATNTVSAGTHVNISSVTPSDKTTSDMEGRTISVGGVRLTVDTAPSSTEVTFTTDITIDIAANTRAYTDDDFNHSESEESFIDDNTMVLSLLKSTFQVGSSTVDIPIGDKKYFAVGDPIVITDGYHRAIMRGEATAVEDHATDTNLAVITLDRTYNGAVVIPSNNGGVSNGFKRTLNPNESASYWVELTVAAENAVDVEVINQYRVGTIFDDVTA